MRYLFFDIECSEGKSMCSFGYVLTDERFGITAKEDVLMNPEAVFHTGAWGRKNREACPGIEMAYPKETFLKRPPFPAFYDKIKNLIEYPDQKVIGFSHKNDTVFLDNACKRYRLPSIDYEFIDVQNVHKDYYNLVNPASTEKLVEELNLDVEKYVPHKSDDDAEVSMLLTESFCRKEGLSLDRLVLLYPNCMGVHKNYNTVYLFKTRAETLIDAINKNSTSKNNTMTNNNFSKYRRFLSDIITDDAVEKTLAGKRVAVNREYFENHFREMLLIAQAVMDRGGVIEPHAGRADIFVGPPSDEERKALAAAERKGRKVSEITVKQLFEMTDIADGDKCVVREQYGEKL
ncbi:MAG: hypothetical protein MSH44_06875 [Christensenellaceae bacterium]|nr:hypothetical protein [Christensenellaceae bacterium]